MAVGLGGPSSGLDYFARSAEDVQHYKMIYSSFLLETDTGDVKRPGHNHCGPATDVFSGSLHSVSHQRQLGASLSLSSTHRQSRVILD